MILMIQKPLVLLYMWPNSIAKYWAWKLLALMSSLQRPCSTLYVSHAERKINWALFQFQVRNKKVLEVSARTCEMAE